MSTAKKSQPRWPRGFEWKMTGRPMLPVTMETGRDEEGIVYCVIVTWDNPSAYENGEDQCGVWSTEVRFTKNPAGRAGGAAFKYAAQEQQEIADQWVAAITKAGK